MFAKSQISVREKKDLDEGSQREKGRTRKMKKDTEEESTERSQAGSQGVNKNASHYHCIHVITF